MKRSIVAGLEPLPSGSTFFDIVGGNRGVFDTIALVVVEVV
jgi:hypothetical protein